GYAAEEPLFNSSSSRTTSLRATLPQPPSLSASTSHATPVLAFYSLHSSRFANFTERRITMSNTSWLWPDVSGEDEAKKACRAAMWCAIIVAGVTALFSFLAMAGTKMNNVPVDGSALLDAAIFGVIAFGLSRYSRIAGVAGFALFLFERIYMLSKAGPAA